MLCVCDACFIFMRFFLLLGLLGAFSIRLLYSLICLTIQVRIHARVYGSSQIISIYKVDNSARFCHNSVQMNKHL